MKSSDIDFKQIVDAELKQVSEAFKRFPWENKVAYVEFISNMYYFLSKACRLLTAAASKCDLEYDKFHHRFTEHALEEKNHEKLVIHDLKALGEVLQPQLFSMYPVWQCQFYMIENVSPLSLFGCILYLENLSLSAEIGPQIYDRCLKTYGKKATTYLRVHVEEDIGHVDTLFKFIEKLPEKEIGNVFESFMVTSSLYKNFFFDLSQKHAVAGSKAFAA